MFSWWMIKVFNKKNDKINRWNYLKEMCPNLKHFDLVIWYKMLHKIIDEGNMHTFVTIEELIVPDTGVFIYVRPNYEWLCEFNRYLSAVEWSCIKINWYPRQSEWFIRWLFYKKKTIFLINRNVEKLCSAVTPLNFFLHELHQNQASLWSLKFIIWSYVFLHTKI